MEKNAKDPHAAPGVFASDAKKKPAARLSESERPRFVIENHEDQVYHDKEAGELGHEPEYFAFMNKVWTFNRRMRWIDAPNDTTICCCDGGDLPLTGNHQVSEWFSEPANEVSNDGEHLRFTKRSQRRRDCVALPAFQFHIDQHPILELEVSEANADWQFCVMIKGRGGAPFLSSDWKQGAGRLSFYIDRELRERGHQNHYAELHFVMGVWCDSETASANVRFKVQLKAKPAVVPCLPVIRTTTTASSDGVPVAALVTDETGKYLGSGQVNVTAIIGEKTIPMSEKDGVWTVRLKGLSEGA